VDGRNRRVGKREMKRKNSYYALGILKHYYPEYIGKPVMSLKKFIFRQVAIWGVFIVCLSLWIYCGLYWKEIKWVWKIPIFALLLFAPELKHLFESYSKYKRRWEEVNGIRN
jgi:cell division protein FtsW (lipid II flippase)